MHTRTSVGHTPPPNPWALLFSRGFQRFVICTVKVITVKFISVTNCRNIISSNPSFKVAMKPGTDIIAHYMPVTPVHRNLSHKNLAETESICSPPRNDTEHYVSPECHLWFALYSLVQLCSMVANTEWTPHHTAENLLPSL